jgi:hypothetical protein
MNKNSKYKQIRNSNNFEIKQIQIPNKNSKSEQISKSKQIWNLIKKSKSKTFFSKSEQIFKMQTNLKSEKKFKI